MQLYSFLLISFLLCFTIGSKAQDIQLTSGSKTKTIHANTFIRVEIPIPRLEPCSDCAGRSVIGKLISYENGNLKIRVASSYESLLEEEYNIGYLYKKYSDKERQPILDIPREDLLSIMKLGNKRARERTTLESIGIVLLALGTANLISSPIGYESDTDTGNRLLAIGLTEMVIGTVLGVTSQRKPYFLSKDCPKMKEGDKIWVFN